MQAWLSLTPDGAGGTHREAYGELLPPLSESYLYLVDLLHSAGTVSSGGMGLSGLSFTELHAFSVLAREPLTRFEAATLRDMSCAYARIASNKNSPCPMQDDHEIQNRINAANIAAWIRVAIHA